MKKIFLKIGTLLVVLLSMVWSCEGYLEQFDMDKLSTEAEIAPSFAAPVAKGNFSIQDILEAVNDSSGLISQTEDEGLIYIYFSDTAFSFEAAEFLKVPNQAPVDFQFIIGDEVDALSGINLGLWGSRLEGEVYSFQIDEKIEFSTGKDDRIDRIDINSGSLNLELYSDLEHHGTINIQSSSIIDSDGNQLNRDFTISDLSGNYDETEVVGLAGYSFVMSHNNDNSFVDLTFDLTFTLSSAGISAADKVGIKVSVSDIEFDAIYGFISERDSTIEESFDLDFFNNIDELPEIFFADPQFNFSVHNSFGIPLSLNIQNFRARSAFDGSYTTLEFMGNSNVFSVDAPTIDQLGETVFSEWNINKETTSNIDTLISSLPDKIDISFLAKVGSPEGATEQNFLLKSSKIELETEVILPLYFSTSGYTLQDTLDIDLSDIMSNASFIEGLEVRLTTINEWPLALAAQIHFIDASNSIVASLPDEKKVLINAAPINAESGLLEEDAELEPYVLSETMDNTDLNDLKDATRMIFEVTVATSTAPDGSIVPVKFLSKYMLNYQVSLGVDFRINPSELDL